jgi:hypothetical protein
VELRDLSLELADEGVWLKSLRELGVGGIDSTGSSKSWGGPDAGNISVRVTVFAREGRGGGEVGVDIGPDRWDLRCWCWIRGVSKELGAKGSCSTIRGEGEDVEVRLFLRTLGLGFWRELRTLGEPVREAEVSGW